MNKKPNFIFIMSDDHAAHAMSCYQSKINKTPNLDRIADEGMRFDNCFCTNSLCAPSRAVILTGKYSHINGVKTLQEPFDGNQDTYPKLLQKAGYQTAIVGKWHLHTDPTGFDYWNVLPGQGEYYNPEMIEMGERKVFKGYVTDIITDLSLDWLKNRDKDRPFCLMCHHKAPHRSWEPNEKHKRLYEDVDIPEPETFYDDYNNRARAAAVARMRVDRDLNSKDLKVEPPEGLAPTDPIPMPDDVNGYSLKPLGGDRIFFETEDELKHWKYQRYIKDYLRCVASIDENVGRILDYLDEEGLTEDTVVIYTSDQGFFLGDHGWYDKRFMYEQSLRMPLVVRYPREIKPGSVCDNIVLNLDFAETFLDYAGIDIPEDMQGVSLRPLLKGEKPGNWRKSMYYRYWRNVSYHNVFAHYGVRTERYKLVYYNAGPIIREGQKSDFEFPEWELFDLQNDPMEINNVFDDPAYKQVADELKEELYRLQKQYGDFEHV